MTEELLMEYRKVIVKPCCTLIFQNTGEGFGYPSFAKRYKRLVMAVTHEQKEEVIQYGESQGWIHCGGHDDSLDEMLYPQLEKRDWKQFFNEE
jgi:hypothetical protein